MFPATGACSGRSQRDPPGHSRDRPAAPVAGIQGEPGPQASPRSLPVRRPTRPLRAGPYPCTPRRADRSIPDRGAGAPNREFISDQVTICFPASHGPSHARTVCCLRNLFPVRHISQQQHHAARLLHSGINCRWRLSATMALTNWLPSSILPAASREPLELAEMAQHALPAPDDRESLRRDLDHPGIYSSAAPKCH